MVQQFSGTATSAALVFPLLGVLTFIFALDLNDSESDMLPFRSSLHYCHRHVDVF